MNLSFQNEKLFAAIKFSPARFERIRDWFNKNATCNFYLPSIPMPISLTSKKHSFLNILKKAHLFTYSKHTFLNYFLASYHDWSIDKKKPYHNYDTAVVNIIL